jgi:hypothetical protein
VISMDESRVSVPKDFNVYPMDARYAGNNEVRTVEVKKLGPPSTVFFRIQFFSIPENGYLGTCRPSPPANIGSRGHQLTK